MVVIKGKNLSLAATVLTSRPSIRLYSVVWISCAIAWARPKTHPNLHQQQPSVALARQWASWLSSVTMTIQMSIWAVGVPNTTVPLTAVRTAQFIRNATNKLASVVARITKTHIPARLCPIYVTLGVSAPTALSVIAMENASSRVNAEIASATASVTHITFLLIETILRSVAIAPTLLPEINFQHWNRKLITISRLDRLYRLESGHY